MKLRIGDKVRFLNEKGGGVIVRLKNIDTAIVEDEDGEVVTLITEDGSIELGNWYPDHELSNTMVHLKVNSDSDFYPVKVADLVKLVQVYNKAEWSSTVISF